MLTDLQKYLLIVVIVCLVILSLVKFNGMTIIQYSYMNYKSIQVEAVANKLEELIAKTGEFYPALVYKAFKISNPNKDDFTSASVEKVSSLSEMNEKLETKKIIGNQDLDLEGTNLRNGVIYYAKDEFPEQSVNEFTYGDIIHFIVYNKINIPFSDQYLTIYSKRSAVVKGRTDTDTGLDYNYGYKELP